MKTLVFQSLWAGNEPAWVARCVGSVRSWAAARQYDYNLAEDELASICGAEYVASVGMRDRRALADLAILELSRRAHGAGYDRTIWMDAGVLVFHPELFHIDLADRYAFLRETSVALVGDRWGFQSSVSNGVFVCMRGEPDLDFLIETTRHVVMHRRASESLETGSALLSGLQKSLAFETIDDVGTFGAPVVDGLAHRRNPPVSTQMLGHGTPIFAARLRASDREGPPVPDRDVGMVIDGLLSSKGKSVNDLLLASTNNLLHGRANPGMAALFPHEINVRLQFRQKHGYEPDLDNPKTFNERVAARKISLTGELWSRTADKLAVREFVREKVGERYLVPLLQVSETADGIDFDALPDAFVLKPTHGSGWKELVPDKSAIDRDALRATMRKWLRSNFFTHYFEIHYRSIPPHIVAEQFLRTEDGVSPNTCMVFVFGGSARVIGISERREGAETTITRFDHEWRPLVVTGRRPAKPSHPRPSCLAEMIDVAEALGRNFDFARIDLYALEGRVYFSEITHTPNGGLTRFTPQSFDDALGRIWESGGPIPAEFYGSPANVSESVPR